MVKKHETVTDNPPLRIYVNKIENRITFRIKTGYFLQFLATETIKLSGSTNRKIAKDKNGENLPRLEITAVVLVHRNIINKIQEYCIHLFLINRFVNY